MVGSTLLRGIAAVAFGVITFFWPGVTLATLVLPLWRLCLRRRHFSDHPRHPRASVNENGGGPRSLVGFVGVAAGVITFLTPNITALALLVVIATWAIVRGVFEIAAAIRLRHAIEGEWLLGLVGALSIAFGVLMLLFPATGALALVLWIGAFAFVSGIMLVVLSFRVRGMARAVHA